MAKVGRRYGLTPGDLARINRFSYNTELHEGQRIVVYSPVGEPPREVTMGMAAGAKRGAKNSPPSKPVAVVGITGAHSSAHGLTPVDASGHRSVAIKADKAPVGKVPLGGPARDGKATAGAVAAGKTAAPVTRAIAKKK